MHEALAPDPTFTTKSPQIRARASQPLRRAIDLGNIDICRRIIHQGVVLDAGYPDCDGCTALLYCLHRKKPEIAEHIAHQGASPVGKVCGHYNPRGDSVFHLAASLNYSGLLKILLELHSDEYWNLNHPAHPLHFAVQSQATDCVELMIIHAEKGKTSSMQSIVLDIDARNRRSSGLASATQLHQEKDQSTCEYESLCLADRTGNSDWAR